MNEENTTSDERCRSSWFLNEKSLGLLYRLFIGVNKIGRHTESDIIVNYLNFVSRHHAEVIVTPDDKSVFIKDLNSVNGIFVNGNECRNCSIELKMGDKIGFGVGDIYDPNLSEGNPPPSFLLCCESTGNIRNQLIPNNTTTNNNNNNKIIVISDDEDDNSNQEIKEFSLRAEEKKYSDLKIEEFIQLSDTDEGGDIPKASNTQSSISKSPNIFESSMEDECDQGNDKINDYNEELLFSQAVLDNIKAEYASDVENEENICDKEMERNVSPEFLMVDNESMISKHEPTIGSPYSSPTEQENTTKTFNQLDPNVCWTVSDEEESDEELDEKVTMWSQRLFSQNHSSQVYELNEPINTVQKFEKEEEFIDDNEIERELFASLQKKLFSTNANLNKRQNTEMKDETLIHHAIEDNQEYIDLEVGIVDDVSSASIVKKEKESIARTPKDAFSILKNQSNEINKPEKSLSAITSPILLPDKHQQLNEGRINDPTDSNFRKEKLSVSCNDKNEEKSISKKYSPPIVIDAMKLPKHRGEHRSTSAQKEEDEKLSKFIEKIRQRENYKQPIQKWLEKSKVRSILSSKAKQQLKKCRKKQLEELALKEKEKAKKEDLRKRKSTEKCSDEEVNRKKVKVKVTENNRGAFLTESVPPPPLVAKGSSRTTETFSQQLAKPDKLLLEKKCKKNIGKIIKTKEPEPVKSTIISTNAESKCKNDSTSEEVCAYRTPSKLTFASMERCFLESTNSLKKLSEAVNKKRKSVKKVRFADKPIIHYIEPVPGANLKVTCKDFVPLSKYRNRRLHMRSKYPIIDCTDIIINNILRLSNTWFTNKLINIDTVTNTIAEPVPLKFYTFTQYKRIFLSLMELEFIAKLEREYEVSNNECEIYVKLEHVKQHKERLILTTKCVSMQNYEEKYSRYDLVLLTIPERHQCTFAYVYCTRQPQTIGFDSLFICEILCENNNINEFKLHEDIIITPALDCVRIEIGSFNALYQLERTPLSEIILNPTKLLENKNTRNDISNIKYKGFHLLNERQQSALLNTYARIIDEKESNVVLIQGPPGTGKTIVISNLALQTLYGDEVHLLDRKILICAQSNAAVNVITARLYSALLKMRYNSSRFRMIRFGNWDKINSKVKFVALENVVIRDQMKQQFNAKKLSYLPPPLMNKQDLKTQVLNLEKEIFLLNAKEIKTPEDGMTLKVKQCDLESLRSILTSFSLPDSKQKLFSYYLSKANIICTTLSSCAPLSHYVDFFDVCIIDEATQCSEPWSLMPLKFAIKSLVLVGDTEQLPATVFSQKANNLGFSTSLFTRIQRCLEESAANYQQLQTLSKHLHSLNVQYRMHPEICLWPNKYFYKNQLINNSNTTSRSRLLQPFTVLNLSYQQNDSYQNGFIINNLEAEFVTKLITVLNEYIPCTSHSYGVITPYAQHRNVLENCIKSLNLPNVMVNTIDSYQGIEKDVIIISNARTNGIGFLSNPQRLNVALTRSRNYLILCGHFTHLESIPVWRSLMQNARERNLYYQITSNCVKDIKSNIIEKMIYKG